MIYHKDSLSDYCKIVELRASKLIEKYPDLNLSFVRVFDTSRDEKKEFIDPAQIDKKASWDYIDTIFRLVNREINVTIIARAGVVKGYDRRLLIRYAVLADETQDKRFAEELLYSILLDVFIIRPKHVLEDRMLISWEGRAYDPLHPESYQIKDPW